MNKIKSLLCACCALGASVVLADAANALISFSSAHDTYADGQTVLDGEWYALVWSVTNFVGITTACNPVNADDEIVLMAPLAKNGGCPFTVFQIDSALVKTGGTYSVYMLDTRDAAKKAVAAKTAEGKPAVVNAAIATVASEANVARADRGGATATKAVEGAAWGATVVDASAGTAVATIKAIRVDGANVKLTVGGMRPGVQYNIQMGGEVDKLSGYALDVPKTIDQNDVEFTVNAKDAKFFKVVRQPIQ